MQELKAIVKISKNKSETVSLGHPDHICFKGFWTLFAFSSENVIVIDKETKLEFDINENRYILRIEE